MINTNLFLQKYFSENEPIILACSSWPDSMFLLYKILETEYKKNLIVCYFNHKTRPGTDIEEKFIEKLWKKLWFKVEVAQCDFEKIKKLYPSKSFEELAREKRYAFFNTILNIYNAKYILTAHHLDDKIETFFFNLARGSKLNGLINMTEKSNTILRPLLNLTKQEILNYLNKNKLEFKLDETNLDTNITRNFLRHEIIPKFEKINWNYKENISHTLNYFEELKKGIDEEVINFLKSSISIKGSPWGTKGMGYNSYFEIEKFNSLTSFMQKEVIRYIYYISNNKSTIWLSEANIAEIIRFINWKNNKTIKEINWLKMFKDNKIIKY